MIIQAELKCKQTRCEADPCAVDKVIELPSQRFQLTRRDITMPRIVLLSPTPAAC